MIIFPLVFVQPGWALEMEAGEGGDSRLSWHGYGELHYNNPKGSSLPKDADPAQMDFHRMVIGLSYEFDDRISLHVEVDFEHAATELELEFAYLDFLIHPALNVRAGSMLMPVGPLNEFHEPPLFYSVERPYVQKHIIPTTWMEGGIGIFGSPFPGLRYRAYVVSSLQAEGFSAGSGIRGGRGKVAKSESEDIVFVGRLEYLPVPGFDLGVSFYEGGADGTRKVGGDANVTIFEWDVRLRAAGVDLQWVYAFIDIDDADQINAAHKTKGAADPILPGVDNRSVGEEIVGWYIEGAYHLANLTGTEWDLVPFVRFEDFNTQDEVPAGFTADPKNDREVITVGLAYYPHPQVALKADLENWEDADPITPDEERWNLGVTYMF
ncbi:MAG: hypothetical protein ACE5HN_06390 [Nitrospiria bacterium]